MSLQPPLTRTKDATPAKSSILASTCSGAKKPRVPSIGTKTSRPATAQKQHKMRWTEGYLDILNWTNKKWTGFEKNLWKYNLQCCLKWPHKPTFFGVGKVKENHAQTLLSSIHKHDVPIFYIRVHPASAMELIHALQGQSTFNVSHWSSRACVNTVSW